MKINSEEAENQMRSTETTKRKNELKSNKIVQNINLKKKKQET